MSALTLLGLAKRAGRLESGDDTVNMVSRAGKAKLILTASDAGRSSLVRAKNSAEAAKCPVAAVPFTKEELGAALGRDTVSVAALTDVGLAHAFVEKLQGEQGGFEALLETLAAENDRALQRQREKRRHERNIKRGK